MLVLEHDDFIGLALVSDLRENSDALNHWLADGDFVVLGNQEDFVELHGASSFSDNLLDGDRLAWLNAVLLTACFYDCIIHDGNRQILGGYPLPVKRELLFLVFMIGVIIVVSTIVETQRKLPLAGLVSAILDLPHLVF